MQKIGQLFKSGFPKEETKGKTAKPTEQDQPQVYKKSGIIFRAQNYEKIGMPNLWSHNKDGFEIKKHLGGIGYKPLDRITDQVHQDMSQISDRISKLLESSIHN